MTGQDDPGEISVDTKDVIHKIKSGGGSSQTTVNSTTITKQGGAGRVNSDLFHAPNHTPSGRLTENHELNYNNSMENPSRYEINARLEAIEARMDARVAGMSSKLDTALAEMRADREANNVRFASMTQDIGEIKSDLKEVKIEFRESASSVKKHAWGAAFTTVGLVVAAIAMTLGAFDSGRETTKNMAESTMRMDKLQAQLEAQTKALQAMTPPAQQQR